MGQVIRQLDLGTRCPVCRYEPVGDEVHFAATVIAPCMTLDMAVEKRIKPTKVDLPEENQRLADEWWEGVQAGD